MEYVFFIGCMTSLVIYVVTLLCAAIYDIRRIRAHRRVTRQTIVIAHNTHSLAQLFRTCLSVSFIKTARLLGVRPAMTHRQRRRKHIIHLLLSTYYILLTATIGYALTVAIRSSIDPILILLGGFAAYFIISVLLFAPLTVLQRVYVLLLAPVALWYSMLLLAVSMLEVFANVAKAVFPIGISLFVRIKNILRVV